MFKKTAEIGPIIPRHVFLARLFFAPDSDLKASNLR